VFRSLRGFRGDASLATWIDRCAVRVAYAHLTSNKRRGTSLELVADRAPTHDGTPSKFLDTHVLRLGPTAKISSIFAIFGFVDVGRAADTLDLIVAPQTLARALSAGYEADSLPGLAGLTADLLKQGTTSRTAEQFSASLTQLGATFSTWAGRDFALVALGARAQAFESSLELMSDAVINPSFGGDDYEGARDAWVQHFLGQAQNLGVIADERVGLAAFGPHPYGHAPYSHPTELSATTRGAVQSFHRDRWRPDRAVLVIAGDIAPERAFASEPPVT